MASALLSLWPIVGGRGCGLSKARGSESGTRGPSSRRQPSPRAGLGSCESGFRPAPKEGGYLINGPLVHLTPISMEIRLEPSVGPAEIVLLNQRTEFLLW